VSNEESIMRTLKSAAVIGTILIVVPALAVASCRAGQVDRATGAITPAYDEATGRLAELMFDSTGDGRIDTWVDMDGPRALSARVDTDGDGIVDRWEYYDASHSSTGGGALVRAEEDTTGDGRPDKWETYAGGAIRAVAFDENGNGRPDRRVTPQASGRVLIESHPDSSGRFTRRVEAN
jgi:hypothetical protein